MEMTILLEKSVLSKAAENASETFNQEQLEEIHMLIDDTSFDRIAQKAGIDIFADEEPEYEAAESCVPPTRKSGPGFFGTLFAMLAVFGAGSTSKRKHNGRCNGDCANCPPHYGYRYGRWYYGHDHVHGCEFGGNRASGSMD